MGFRNQRLERCEVDMIDIPVRFWKIDMAGSRPLYDPDVQGAILDVLEQSSGFAPEVWSTREVGGEPYDRDELLEWVCSGPKNIPQFLRRKKAVKYELMADRRTNQCFASGHESSPLPNARCFLLWAATWPVCSCPTSRGCTACLQSIDQGPTPTRSFSAGWMWHRVNTARLRYMVRAASGFRHDPWTAPGGSDWARPAEDASCSSSGPRLALGGIQVDLLDEPWKQTAGDLRASWD